MVEKTNKNEQNAAQVIQQENDEALQLFMLSASVDFSRTNGFEKTKKVGSSVDFNMGGVNYICDKRKIPGENNALWITNAYPDSDKHETAAFDARTRKLKASLFLTARQLFDMLALLED